MSGTSIQLSIILPALNAEGELDELFESLKNQTGIDKSRVEIILIDDGSTDGTVAAAKKHKALDEFADFKIISQPQRMGLAQARFDGAQAAKGKYISFVDKKTRPDPNYFASFMAKKRDIIIGNVYMDPKRSVWDALLTAIRIRLYRPYFNQAFDDILLDHAAYKRFKNKGGGGAMFVRRDYFLKAAKGLKRGFNVNDDSQLITKLSTYDSILKSSSPKILYINRVGLRENLGHIYNRGPKFVDFYIQPGTRFFPYIMTLLLVIALNSLIVSLSPSLMLLELRIIITGLVVASIFLADSVKHFFAFVVLLPLIAAAFVAGIIKGLIYKLFRLY